MIFGTERAGYVAKEREGLYFDATKQRWLFANGKVACPKHNPFNQ